MDGHKLFVISNSSFGERKAMKEREEKSSARITNFFFFFFFYNTYNTRFNFITYNLFS